MTFRKALVAGTIALLTGAVPATAQMTGHSHTPTPRASSRDSTHGTLSLVPASLKDAYGDHPASGLLFTRVTLR